jgi:hypothetical protein
VVVGISPSFGVGSSGKAARKSASASSSESSAFRERKQLVGLLVKSVSLGKRQDDGRAEIQITYRFGPPRASGVLEA